MFYIFCYLNFCSNSNNKVVKVKNDDDMTGIETSSFPGNMNNFTLLVYTAKYYHHKIFYQDRYSRFGLILGLGEKEKSGLGIFTKNP